MALVARDTDIAVGEHKIGDDTCWNIAVLTGVGSVYSEGRRNSVKYSMANGNCGDGMVIQGSGKVYMEGRGAARIGDLVVCFCDGRNDTIITSAGTVDSI